MDWDWGEDLAIIGLIIIVILSLIYSYDHEKHYIHYYKYVDLDNNEGIAKNCQFSNNKGQGSPICKLEDGTILSVKSYKYIEEKIK